MWGRVIMKKRNLHHIQVFYHAYPTIQANDQAIRDRKPIPNGIKIPKAKEKQYRNWKLFTKIEKIFTRTFTKGYMIFHPHT